jgi:hypothetical protein
MISAVIKTGPFMGQKLAIVKKSYRLYLYLILCRNKDIYYYFKDHLPMSNSAIDKEVELELIKFARLHSFVIKNNSRRWILHKITEYNQLEIKWREKVEQEKAEQEKIILENNREVIKSSENASYLKEHLSKIKKGK